MAHDKCAIHSYLLFIVTISSVFAYTFFCAKENMKKIILGILAVFGSCIYADDDMCKAISNSDLALVIDQLQARGSALNQAEKEQYADLADIMVALRYDALKNPGSAVLKKRNGTTSNPNVLKAGLLLLLSPLVFVPLLDSFNIEKKSEFTILPLISGALLSLLYAVSENNDPAYDESLYEKACAIKQLFIDSYAR